jgi:hypothetical protein
MNYMNVGGGQKVLAHDDGTKSFLATGNNNMSVLEIECAMKWCLRPPSSIAKDVCVLLLNIQMSKDLRHPKTRLYNCLTHAEHFMYGITYSMRGCSRVLCHVKK